ncbi:DUF4219 domain-containing protein [Tanacetum coccineum]
MAYDPSLAIVLDDSCILEKEPGWFYTGHYFLCKHTIMASNPNSLNVSQPQIPVFKGDSYEFWSIKMKTLFQSQDLWEYVESGFEVSDDDSRNKEHHKRDAKALFFIQQAVDESIFPRIAVATSSKQA